MTDQDLKNETLNAEDEKLRQMLSSLERVEASKDFDFQLKARIANSRAGDFQRKPVWAVMRYALPLLAVALLIGTVIFRGGFWAATPNSPTAVIPNNFENKNLPEPNPALATRSVEANRNDSNETVALATNQTPAKIVKTTRSSKEISPENSPIFLTNRNKNTSEGVKESTQKNANIIQPGLNSNILSGNLNIQSSNRKGPEQMNPISIQMIFSEIGIRTTVENGKWIVKSLTPNSLAERSGVQTGDLIEALDNKKISPDSTFTQTLNVKSITVLRGGRLIEIKLQN